MRLALLFVLAAALPWLSPAQAQQELSQLMRTDRVWVKARSPINVQDLEEELDLDQGMLIHLNDVSEWHIFESGDWIVLPSKSKRKAQQLAAIDESSLRLTPPLEPLDPWLGPSHLSAPPEPALPNRSTASRLRFDQSLDELVRQGIVFPSERNVIRNGGGISPSWGDIPSATQKPLSPREQALLERIRSGGSGPKWRTYGQCNYDWSGWKLHDNGIRTTAADCGGTAMRWTVGVSCDRLLVAIHTSISGWQAWERPAGPNNKFRRGEDQMVAALCANAVPSNKP